MLLKDVLDCSLEDVAEIIESNVGAVKAALHRGRAKLARREAGEPPTRESATRRSIDAYVASFNRRDWAAVRALVREDARVEVVDAAEGRGHAFLDRGYFVNYGRIPVPWRLRVGEVDGEPVVIQERHDGTSWRPHTVIRLELDGDRIVRIRDYSHVDYLLAHASVR